MENLRDLTGQLRWMGYRITPQRVMILSCIENSNSHITAEGIYAQVIGKYPRVNISTVYRTLDLLKQLGLIYEIDLGEGMVGYHPEGKGHHHHLICRKCNSITDINESPLFSVKAVLLQAFNFDADLKHLALFGLCENCREG
ncbi:MAG: transcriptional repressor [Dehalococcoidales bacterium]|nr:MAG: transcriptional repressor [Dehalococcoidales bacterium]